MLKVYLKKKISRRIENGHPWIFANEVGQVEGDAAGTGIAEVFTHDKKFVGKGYLNSRSQILVRLLTRDKAETIDESFFGKRIQEAWEYRKKIGYTENCRLVFGEADQLPALIIDKFNDYFVLQTLALGMDVWKPAIVKALEAIFRPRGIYERNDVPVRELEGLPSKKAFCPPHSIPGSSSMKTGFGFMWILKTARRRDFFSTSMITAGPFSIL